MEFLSDPVILARIQFAFTAMYHFLLVPVSIGLGLIVAIYETRYYKSGKEEDAAASRFGLRSSPQHSRWAWQPALRWSFHLAPTGPITHVL